VVPQVQGAGLTDSSSEGSARRWFLPDGTVLFAPPGRVAVDPNEGLVCCHLCGRWWVALGSHVRVHGHTAESYRQAMGLRVTVALAAVRHTSAIGSRQRQRYAEDPVMRERLEVGHEMARSGSLTAPARAGNVTSGGRVQRQDERTRELDAGREARWAPRRAAQEQRLASLGAGDLSEFLRAAYRADTSIDSLAHATGLGKTALRDALIAAGVELRPPGSNTPAGKRARARTADERAASRVGTKDIRVWLRDRRTEGWSLARLADSVGRSSPWVRSRLAPPEIPKTGAQD